MHCTECGGQCPQGTKFCRHCGASMAGGPQRPRGSTGRRGHAPPLGHTRRAAPPINTTIIVIAIGVGVLLIGLVLFLVLSGGRERQMQGRWELTSTMGAYPDSISQYIMFHNDGDSGTGNFTDSDMFSGRHPINFQWSFNDAGDIHMTTVPGVLFLRSLANISMNSAGNAITITYDNGSQATFTRR